MKAGHKAWDIVESMWGPNAVHAAGGYDDLRRELESFLADNHVQSEGFSHYGIVVRDVDVALKQLQEARDGVAWLPARRDQVAAFQVLVVRGDLEGTELEFIQPLGASFFASFLEANGEGLHHVSFRVNDLEASFQRLVERGTCFVDDAIRQGSHGSIAFALPRVGGSSVVLELCQPR